MTQTINFQDAKTRLSQLLQQVEEGDEIIISRANNPIAGWWLTEKKLNNLA